MKQKTTGPLIANGEIAVDAKKFPALRRALERGRDLATKEREGWARVIELRRSGQGHAAERLLKDLLGVKSEPMSDETKAALRAKRAAMTDEEKQAEKEKRKADRILRRLAARRPGQETNNPTEEAMAKKKSTKSKAAKKSVAKTANPKATKERDPRIPAPGSTIEREYKDKKYSVKVLDTGFQYDGETYTSLSALAKKITGAASINGVLFFGLTTPKLVEAK